MRYINNFIVLAMAFLIVYLYISGRITRIQYDNDRIKSTVNSLRLGMSFDEVEIILKQHYWPTDLLELNREYQEYTARSNRVFGYNNWILFLILDSGSLVSIRIRTDNATCEHPIEAPKDIDKENFSNEEMKRTEIKWEF